MKILRIAGLLLIVLTAVGGAVSEVRASDPIRCWKRCGSTSYSGQCWASLEQCCSFNRNSCPAPSQFVSGNCTDGVNYCP
ncbi:MAG TPA: hypothetical protein VF789_10895 [Thermoanaerobaculia bacterium]